MSFYQSRPSQPASEPEQHAQTAKKKKTSPLPPPEPPKKKSLFDKMTGFFFGEAEAMPLPPPPVELLEVELYSDFKGRSRQGKYEADHMSSRAAVEQLLMDEYPGLDQKLISKMADRVAAIVVPKEVHQKN